MATELVTFKLDTKFLREVDAISSESGFSNRTDFIRDALREKIEELRLKEAMIKLSELKGTSKRRTSDREVHEAREKVLTELLKKKFR